MFLFLLLGISLTGAATVLLARTLAFDRVRRRETLSQIGAYGFASRTIPTRTSFGPREVVDRAASFFGEFLSRRLGDPALTELKSLLRSAGFYRTTVEQFVGYRVMFATIPPLLWLCLAIASGSAGAMAVLAIVTIGALGWILPKFALQRRAARRLEAIDREMPELVDLLVTTVEAGIGFAASLQLVSRRIEGPLGQELRLALQEQSMGLTIEEALEHMLARADSVTLRAFVQAIIQGQTLGVSIGKILRDLAVDMRKRRRQAAEERAHKAPTKLLFPLIFLILPALFIVALAGPFISVIRGLGSIG